MSTKKAIAVAYGDGIGPEIMAATLQILEASGAAIEPHTVRLGEEVFLSGNLTGIDPAAWDVIRDTKVLLKSPLKTPQGGGYKSVNVTIRKTLGLYANVRPFPTYAPFVPTLYPGMDLVIIRENEEDLYAGIEHRQTDEVMQCLKLISRPGCERISRYAFEYARAYGRKKVTCLSKDNIMKLTDGLFHSIFDEIGAEYPEIERDHMIVDIGAARIATRPQDFDVVLTENLYGDIVSDIAAEISGSVGIAGSANIGGSCAMFEAVHGSAPDIAGMGIANPSGLLLGAVQMLIHLGQQPVAERIHNAWLATLESGIHTGDLGRDGAVGTQEFADAVVGRLGQLPVTLPAAHYSAGQALVLPEVVRRPSAKKERLGVDVFVHYTGEIEELARLLQLSETGGLKLTMITNRGLKVWPNGFPETLCTDHWRCRFLLEDMTQSVSIEPLLNVQQRAAAHGLDVIKAEFLCRFDGVAGYSAGQGA